MTFRTHQSLLDLQSLDITQVSSLFSLADHFSVRKEKLESQQGFGKTGALLFFEPSTRTRLSFESACIRSGVYPLLLEGKAGSSLEKGETLEDTILNVNAMNPAFLVVRCGDELNLKELAEKIQTPILNAGWGRKGHPTQALLDAYTIYRRLGTCQGQRLLIVGDVKHSRVAASHFELAKVLGYEVALCGPTGFLPAQTECKVFDDIEEAFSWAQVAMALRVQLERHAEKHALHEYREKFGFTAKNLRALSDQALILHPGPINHGVEMDSEVLQDPRCQVLTQVSNGVLIRQSLIHTILTGEK